jgi:outer membrane immunogenic protein
MKRIILGAVAALTLSMGQAFADGLPTRSRMADTAPVAAPKWSGVYIGLGIGAGSATSELSLDVSGFGSIFSLDGIGSAGTFGTVTVGYDRAIGKSLVAGVFADYDFGSSMSSDLSIFGLTVPLIDLNNSWSVGARLGVLTSPSTLVYGTAGYTRTDVDIVGGFIPGLPSSMEGYFVGAGIETFLHSSWTLKLEYRYTSYDTETLVAFGPVSLNLDTETHAARAVLSYKFGHRD